MGCSATCYHRIGDICYATWSCGALRVLREASSGLNSHERMQIIRRVAHEITTVMADILPEWLCLKSEI